MIHAESAMADSTMYVEDAGTLAPVADAATVQLAKIEHQMITATELYDLLDLALSGVRQLASGALWSFGSMTLSMNSIDISIQSESYLAR
jgi:hypothetical protein